VETQDEHAPTSALEATAPRSAAAMATDVGRRTINADAALIDDAAGLYAVADGVGDTPRSRLAADQTLAAVREMFGRQWTSHPPGARPVEEARGKLKLGVEGAHRRIHGRWWAPQEQPRATFAGVVVCGEHLVMGHVGDSRIYLLRASGGGLAQQTTDHTVLGEALRRGMEYDAAAALPDAHILIQVLGGRRGVDVRPFVKRWKPGDVALLCTDGLSDCLEPDAMTEIVLGAPDLGVAARRLVDQAIANGGADNVTALVVRHAG
jgi:serine/threonine protein phosphatase PrpC